MTCESGPFPFCMGGERMKEKKVKPEMLEAAALMAEGKSAREVAAKLGRSETTVRRWMHDEAVRSAYREAILRTATTACAKAVKVLERQLDGEDESLAQRAAKDMLDRFGGAVLKEDEREIVVRVVNMPSIGMPEAVE